MFRWEIQLPFGLLCVGAYFYFVAWDGRKEPVLAGIGYGASAIGIYEFFLRRSAQKVSIPSVKENAGAASRRV